MKKSKTETTLALVAKDKKGIVVVDYSVPSKLLKPLKQLGIKVVREGNIDKYLDTKGIVPIEPSIYYVGEFIADEEKFDKILYIAKGAVDEVVISYAVSFAVKCINNGLIKISAPIDVCVDVPGEVASVSSVPVSSKSATFITVEQLEINYLANSIFLIEKGFSLGREDYYNVFIPLIETSANYNLIHCTEYPYSVPSLIPHVAKNPHINVRILNNIFHYVCSNMGDHCLCENIVANLLNNPTVIKDSVMYQQSVDFDKFMHNTWTVQSISKGAEF